MLRNFNLIAAYSLLFLTTLALFSSPACGSPYVRTPLKKAWQEHQVKAIVQAKFLGSLCGSRYIPIGHYSVTKQIWGAPVPKELKVSQVLGFGCIPPLKDSSAKGFAAWLEGSLGKGSNWILFLSFDGGWQIMETLDNRGQWPLTSTNLKRTSALINGLPDPFPEGKTPPVPAPTPSPPPGSEPPLP